MSLHYHAETINSDCHINMCYILTKQYYGYIFYASHKKAVQWCASHSSQYKIGETQSFKVKVEKMCLKMTV